MNYQAVQGDGEKNRPVCLQQVKILQSMINGTEHQYFKLSYKELSMLFRKRCRRLLRTPSAGSCCLLLLTQNRYDNLGLLIGIFYCVSCTTVGFCPLQITIFLPFNDSYQYLLDYLFTTQSTIASFLDRLAVFFPCHSLAEERSPSTL